MNFKKLWKNKYFVAIIIIISACILSAIIANFCSAFNGITLLLLTGLCGLLSYMIYLKIKRLSKDDNLQNLMPEKDVKLLEKQNRAEHRTCVIELCFFIFFAIIFLVATCFFFATYF